MRTITGSAGVNIRTGIQHTERVLVDQDGNLVFSALGGGNLVFSKANTGVRNSVATGLTATGSAIGDALQLSAIVNNVTTTAASTGVKLSDSVGVGQMVHVRNGGANALSVYPPNGSGQINGATAGNAVSVAAGAHVMCVKVAANQWIAFESPAA